MGSCGGGACSRNGQHGQHVLNPLKECWESGVSYSVSPDGFGKDEQKASSPRTLQQGDLGTSSSSEDSGTSTSSKGVQSSVREAVPSPQGSICISRPASVTQEGCDTSQAGTDVVSGGTPIAASAFPGFVETEFSCAEQQYFYKGSRQKSRFGSGSFGVVTKVYWRNPETSGLEPCVAKTLDVIRGEAHPDGLEGRRVDALREVAALCRVAGVRRVPGFLDLVTELDGTMHIILEQASGLDISTRMLSRDVWGVGLSWQEIRRVLRDLAEVLAHCHELGVVHGDIKLAHVITHSEHCGVTLVDFGAASLRDGVGWEHYGGTVLYAAPELLSSARTKPAVDAPPCFTLHGPAVDCWAFGVLALELLTGCRLFSPDTEAMPEDIVGDEWEAWHLRSVADLHAEWEAQAESSALHTTFKKKTELMSAASEDCKRAGSDFLRALLHPDPSKRMTAEGALCHPFLTSDFPEVALELMPARVKPKPVPQNTMERQLWEACVNAFKFD